MLMTRKRISSCHIGRRVDKQGPRCQVGDHACNDNCATGKQLSRKFRMGTRNVQRMKELGKLNTVCSEMDRNNVDILGICETNWTKKADFRPMIKS